MKPPVGAPVSAKFHRQYQRTRDAFEASDGSDSKSILNTLFSVYPVAFESPESQARIRKAYEGQATHASLYHLNLMRLFRRSRAIKTAICCMPKSGSTFIQTSLQRVEGANLQVGHLHTPYANVDFVSALSREQEIDELALLILELRGINWISHMHTKWTPYTETVFRAYGIRPIITYRNIFDCIVSMDDMLMKRQVGGFPMVRIPRRYFDMPTDERLGFLAQYAGPWYIDYVVSWSRCRLKTLRLDYDRDVRGFGEHTATAIRDHLGLEVGLETMMKAFALDDKGREIARFNQGVSGRGERVPRSAREQLSRLADIYRDEVDFGGLL